MEHAKDIDLIELAGGRLDPERRESVQRHLEQCPVCRQTLEQLRRTWDILGAWQVCPAGQPETVSRVLAHMPVEGLAAPSVVRFPYGVSVLRFAAAVAVTALVGYAGGRLTGRQAVPSTIEPPRYVSALGLGIGEGLSSLVLQDEPSAAEEGRI